MVRQFYESPMNRIRSELAQRIPREYWPRRNISREEISDLLFFDSDASLKKIASFLSIDISDERGNYSSREVIDIYAIDIESRDVVEIFNSIGSVCRVFLILRGGSYNYSIYKIIENQFAFSLYGRYVILSLTPDIEGEINPIIDHCLNLPRFRKFLLDMGYNFMTYKTSVSTIRHKLKFDRDTSLKTMMEHFFLPWGRKDTGGYRDRVLVRVVTPTSVSDAMSLSGVSRELSIDPRCVRDYINREVFFRYRSIYRDSFLIYD